MTGLNAPGSDAPPPSPMAIPDGFGGHPDQGDQTQNAQGQWVPAIPMPLFTLATKRCRCGRRFWTLDGYRGHYAYAHILGMGDR